MSGFDHFILFASTFANVFLLGFQSKNVYHSRYLMAGATSMGITLAQYFFVRYAANDGGLQFISISGLGGALGIMTAIWVHDHMTRRRELKESQQ